MLFRVLVADKGYMDEVHLRFLSKVCDERLSKEYLQMIQANGAKEGYQKLLDYLNENFSLKVGKTQFSLKKLMELRKMEDDDLTGVRQVHSDLREYRFHLWTQGEVYFLNGEAAALICDRLLAPVP